MRLFNGVDELRAAAGTHVGESEWVIVAQSQIDLFAASVCRAGASGIRWRRRIRLIVEAPTRWPS